MAKRKAKVIILPEVSPAEMFRAAKAFAAGETKTLEITGDSRNMEVFQQIVIREMQDAVRRVSEADDLNRGRRVKEAAHAGGKQSRKLTDHERESAKSERDQLIEAGHSKHDACQQIREKYGVSYKTIERL